MLKTFRPVLFFFVLALLPALSMAAATGDQPSDILLVLDNSGSMKRNDPARLTAEAVTSFIQSQTAETRLGLLLFADNPRLVVPLLPVTSENARTLQAGLTELNYSGRWTETAEAMERAIYELRVNGRADAVKAIVLMTDGILDSGNPERDRARLEWLRTSLVLEAQRHDIRIFGLAFSEEADYQLLQFLSQATGGEYFRALQPEEIGPALDGIQDRLAELASRPAADMPDPVSAATAAGSEAEPEPAGTGAARPQSPTEPERIVYTGPAATPAEGRDAGTTTARVPAQPGSGHLILLWLLGGLVVIFLLAGSGWWVYRHSRLAAVLRGGDGKAQEDHGPRAVLYDVHDPSNIVRHELAGKPVVIGRVGGSDPAMDYIVVEERTVGRWHATIERRGQSFWIRDEGSVNGTFVNENRVTTEHPLKHGDMVRVHKHEFEFVIPELFDSDRTLMANERTRARAIETARATTTGRQTLTERG